MEEEKNDKIEVKEIKLNLVEDKPKEIPQIKPLPVLQGDEGIYTRKVPSKEKIKEVEEEIGSNHKVIKNSTIIFIKIAVIFLLFLIFGGIFWFNYNFGLFIQKNQEMNLNAPTTNYHNFTIENTVSPPSVTVNPTTNLNATVEINNPNFNFYDANITIHSG